MSDITILSDSTGADAGAVCFWNLRGPTPYDALSSAWEAAGLSEDLLPRRTTVPSAMRSAIRSAGKLPKGYFTRKMTDVVHAIIREVQDGEKGGADGLGDEFILVGKIGVKTYKDHDDAPDRHKVWSKVKRSLPDADKLVVATYHGLVEDAFHDALDNVSIHDFDRWSRDIIRDYVQSIGLGADGNKKPWFVAPSMMDRWDAVKTAWRAANDRHVVTSIPAMRTTDTLSAVVGACVAEVHGLVDSVTEEIEDGQLGSRALKTRQRMLDDARKKLETFGDLLGDHVKQLEAELDACNDAIVEVSLEADAAAEDDE